MVAMSHGVCVCVCVYGETTKNKVGYKNGECFLELIDHVRLGIFKLADNIAQSMYNNCLIRTITFHAVNESYILKCAAIILRVWRDHKK
jgi:hypothetical protein